MPIIYSKDGTPYFEDVTLFYDQGDVEFLLYAVVNTI